MEMVSACALGGSRRSRSLGSVGLGHVAVCLYFYVVMFGLGRMALESGLIVGCVFLAAWLDC